MKIQKATRISMGDRLFGIVNSGLLLVVLLVMLFPFYYVIISSISDPAAVNTGKVLFWPVGITFAGYRKILLDPQIWSGYVNSIKYIVVGTSINVAMTMTAAFALSRKQLRGRTFIMTMIVFTMYFSGGLIPRFLVVNQLGLYDTLGAMVLPGAVGAWNLIIARTFLQNTIPEELYEASYMDGCSHFRAFFQIALPLSPTILAIIALFYGVNHWNAFFDAMIFLKSASKYPLQLVTRNLLILSQAYISSGDGDLLAEQLAAAEQMKFGMIIISVAPMLILYPFVQKYFVKGVMVGGVKG